MKAVVLLSGGLDSYTAAAITQRQGFELHALTVRYGQQHEQELVAARTGARSLHVVQHREFPVDLAAFGGSSLTGDGPIPKLGMAVTSSNQVTSGIPSTYVPARNTVLLSLALAWAEGLGARDLVIGVNAIDYSGYPDCRPAFIVAFEQLTAVATKAGVEGGPFTVHAPLIHLSKADIIRQGIALNLNYGLTHSCYDPKPDGRPCEACDSCCLRARGFQEVGVLDPALAQSARS